jgi:hypothetical protein
MEKNNEKENWVTGKINRKNLDTLRKEVQKRVMKAESLITISVDDDDNASVACFGDDLDMLLASAMERNRQLYETVVNALSYCPNVEVVDMRTKQDGKTSELRANATEKPN